MAIKTYSVKQSGSALLSDNFRVREFASKDGNDIVLIDLDLVTMLQKIRTYFHSPVIINSAYRTASHNKKVGGSIKSKHLEGKAADIVVTGVAPLKVCQYAESIGIKGVGRYNSFTHIDTRTSQYYWDSRAGTEKAVTSFGVTCHPIPTKTLKKGDSGNDVKWVQTQLKSYGYDPGTVDGVFGTNTDHAVRAFQQSKGLAADGIVGVKTRKALS